MDRSCSLSNGHAVDVPKNPERATFAKLLLAAGRRRRAEQLPKQMFLEQRTN